MTETCPCLGVEFLGPVVTLRLTFLRNYFCSHLTGEEIAVWIVQVHGQMQSSRTAPSITLPQRGCSRRGRTPGSQPGRWRGKGILGRCVRSESVLHPCSRRWLKTLECVRRKEPDPKGPSSCMQEDFKRISLKTSVCKTEMKPTAQMKRQTH